MTQSTPEASAAYRANLCTNLCGKPYAAGMTKCLTCRSEQDVVLIEPRKKEVL